MYDTCYRERVDGRPMNGAHDEDLPLCNSILAYTADRRANRLIRALNAESTRSVALQLQHCDTADAVAESLFSQDEQRCTQSAENEFQSEVVIGE